MKSENNNRKEELLAGLVLNNLTAEESAELSIIFSNPKQLEEEKEDYKNLVNRLETITPIEASDNLRDRILNISKKEVYKEKGSSAWKMIALCFGGISASLFLQLNNERLQMAQESLKNIEKSTIAQTANFKQFDLLPINSSLKNGKTIKANLVVRSSQATNLLNIDGLPQLNSGQTYRLWAFTPKGPQGCVTFLPNDQGKVIMQVPSEPSSSAKKVLITIDNVTPGYGPEGPGKTILTSI
tara:strand:- start:1031 stop:1753 length:723 start_codon:yes stop_codon:yes gene_type:complete